MRRWQKLVLRRLYARPGAHDYLLAEGDIVDRLRRLGADRETVAWSESCVREARRRIEVWS